MASGLPGLCPLTFLLQGIAGPTYDKAHCMFMGVLMGLSRSRYTERCSDWRTVRGTPSHSPPSCLAPGGPVRDLPVIAADILGADPPGFATRILLIYRNNYV
jgi:hypothetical protein